MKLIQIYNYEKKTFFEKIVLFLYNDNMSTNICHVISQIVMLLPVHYCISIYTCLAHAIEEYLEPNVKILHNIIMIFALS